MTMATTPPKEMFEYHVGALESGDVGGVLAVYSEHAMILTVGRRARQVTPRLASSRPTTAHRAFARSNPGPAGT